MDEGRAPGVATSAAHLGLRPADVRCEAPSTLQYPHGDPEEGRVDGPPVPRSHAGRVSSSGRPPLPPRPQREGIRVMRLRTRLAALALSLLGLSGIAALAADPPAPKGKPLAVLFLGDKGLHRPHDRYAQIAPILAGRGIEVAYTEKVSDLNPETLGKYDALLIYANTTEITKDQEKALLDYVANGGGFVPLHCASFCFLNSPEYIALVGGPVPEARHRRVRDEGRRPRPPHHQGAGALPHLGRDLRPHQGEQGPPRPPDARRPDRLGALDLDPHPGQGARLLHRVWPRRADLGPPRLPRPGRARHPLGREQGRRVRFEARAWRRA